MKNFPKHLLVFCISMANMHLSLGQDTIRQMDKSRFEAEFSDDPYLPNAFNNKKTTPAYRYHSPVSPVGRIRFGTNATIVSTVQVNVDANGNNIVGDAANEPNITINPLNNAQIAIGWRQFDNVASNFRQAGLAYSSDSGNTWTFPGCVDAGIFHSDPVLDFDSAGTFYYNALFSDSNGFSCKVFKSQDAGMSWDTGTDAHGGDKQWMAIDRTNGVGSGNIYSFWSSNNSACPPAFFTRSTTGGSSYENCLIPPGDSHYGTMAVGINGEIYFAGTDFISGIVVNKSLNANTPGSLISWENEAILFMYGDLGYGPLVNPNGLLGQANIDVDRSNGLGSGNVYVLASIRLYNNVDPGDIMFSKSIDGGYNWTAGQRINDDVSQANTQWFGTMSVAPNGRIDAIWLDTRDGQAFSDSSALYYSYSLDEGFSWTANERISDLFDPHLGYPNQNKMGDYFDMISDNIGVHLAWANTFNGEQDVYYSRIIPQISIGMDEEIGNRNISIYPNPSSGIFNVSLHGLGYTFSEMYFEIYNMMGELIFSEATRQSNFSFDLSKASAGIYMMKIFDSDGNWQVRIFSKN